jgi:outer membrane murein-binding lipoprotein Lpp
VKAKLAATETPTRDDKAEARLAELNTENDPLALKVERLQRAAQAREQDNARLTKRVDELVADLASLRSRVANWKAEDNTVSADEPARVKGKRAKSSHTP